MSTKRIYKSNLIFLAVLIFVSCKESKTEQKLSAEDIPNSQKFDLKVGEKSLKSYFGYFTGRKTKRAHVC